jgi:hypothetical protein
MTRTNSALSGVIFKLILIHCNLNNPGPNEARVPNEVRENSTLQAFSEEYTRLEKSSISRNDWILARRLDINRQNLGS